MATMRRCLFVVRHPKAYSAIHIAQHQLVSASKTFCSLERTPLLCVESGNVSVEPARVQFDGLIKEINEFQVRRKRSERRLNVPASNIPTTKTKPAQVERNVARVPQLSGPTSSVVTDPLLSSVPFVLRDPPVLTDVACTLHELESALFQISEDEGALLDEKVNVVPDATAANNDDGYVGASSELEGSCVDGGQSAATEDRQAAADAGELLSAQPDSQNSGLRCWLDDTVVPTSRICSDTSLNTTSLHVEWLSERTVALELRENPASVVDLVAGLNSALSTLEAVKEWSHGLVVVLRTARDIPFYTPKHSELELTPINRLEVMRAKSRLFRRMGEASRCGVVFVGEIGVSALDFGAELLFTCARVEFPISCADEVRVGFPSLQFGVWPSPDVLKRLSGVVGYGEGVTDVVPAFHTLPWGEWRKLYPQLSLLSDMECQSWSRVWLPEIMRGWWQWRLWFYQKMCGAFRQDLTPFCDAVPHNTPGGLWNSYCALVTGTETDGGADVLDKSINMYAELMANRDIYNSACVVAKLDRMHNRVLNPLPCDDRSVVSPGCSADSLTSSAPFLIFAEDALGGAAKLIAQHRSSFDLNSPRYALLIGESDAVKDVAALLDCAVVATPVCAPKVAPLGGKPMVEVQVLPAVHVADNESKVALSSALAYFQSTEVPYIVTRGGDVSKRLLAALSLELCQLASETECWRVEGVARRRLGFSTCPFELMDRYGAAFISAVIDRYEHMKNFVRQVPPASRLLLAAAGTGGFYDKTGRIAGSVAQRLRSEEPTDGEIFVRLLGTVLNESCSLLLDGTVESTDDINLASVFCFGLKPSVGGILSCMDDNMSLSTLVREMLYMSRGCSGVSTVPSPLLRAMDDASESFRTLSADTIRRARGNMLK